MCHQPLERRRIGTARCARPWRSELDLATTLGEALVLVRHLPPIPACHAKRRGLKFCKPLLHSNERRLFGCVYHSAEMALGLASGFAATALQGLPFPTNCNQRVRLDPA